MLEQNQTPDGISDLAGNVAEWVQDVFVEHYPACKGEWAGPDSARAGAAPTPDPGADSASKKAKSSKKKGSDASVMLRVIRGGSLASQQMHVAAQAVLGEPKIRPRWILVFVARWR